MLAISLAVLLFTGAPQQTRAIQANLQEQPSQKSSAETDSSKLQTTPKEAPPDTDTAAMNQAPKGSQGALLNGSKGMMSDPAMQKKIAEMRARNETHRQAAIRINEMAANIHSEKDARALVDAIAEELTHHKHLLWAALT